MKNLKIPFLLLRNSVITLFIALMMLGGCSKKLETSNDVCPKWVVPTELEEKHLMEIPGFFVKFANQQKQLLDCHGVKL